jgi:hypothetical protein
MTDDFQLPITYKGKELSYPARLLHFGYVYKFEVEVEATIIQFERDDSGDWRALLSPHDLEQNKTIDKELMQALIESIKQITA